MIQVVPFQFSHGLFQPFISRQCNFLKLYFLISILCYLESVRWVMVRCVTAFWCLALRINLSVRVILLSFLSNLCSIFYGSFINYISFFCCFYIIHIFAVDVICSHNFILLFRYNLSIRWLNLPVSFFRFFMR